MARITQNTIDRIFETARIEEVIGDFVQLKRSGSNLKGLSPFNKEKTPSFMVSPAKQIFKDFSSGKGGSVVTFLMDHEHFSYPEALRWLANRYGIEIEEDGEQTPEQQQAENEREAIYIISKFAKEWFEEQLKSDEGKQIGRSYFRERGFSDEIIEKFGLGYSPTRKDAFALEALNHGYSEKALSDSGISLKREGQKNWYDRFWGRVMFPIFSLSGRVLGFGGRVLNAEAKTAKYLNSPENLIYHKSRILYGLYQAKNAIVKNDEALLVEGYTDVLSLFQIGVENVVASSGTALTEDQIRLIKRYTNNITILYDGDAAGIRASFRGIDMILAEGMNVRVVLFPDGEDPDSFARHTSPIEFKEFIAENRKDFIRFKASILMAEVANDPIKKAQAIREIVTSIAKIPNDISREVFVKESARLLEMKEESLSAELATILSKNLREEMRKGARPRMQVVQQQEEQPTPEWVEGTKGAMHHEQEKEIINLLVNYGNEKITLQAPEEETEEEESTIAQILIGDIDQDDLKFENDRFQLAYDSCFNYAIENEGVVPPTDWYVKNENAELNQLLADLYFGYTLSPKWEELGIFIPTPSERINRHTPEAVLRFKDAKLELRMAELRNELREEMTDEEKKLAMAKHRDLNKLRVFIRKELRRVV